MEHDRLQLIESRAETLLSELKEDNDSFVYSTSLLIMVVLFLLAIVFLYIKIGFSINLLIYLVGLTGMLAYYKMNMNKAFSENARLANYKSIDTDDKVNYVTGLLKYLSSGFDVKLTRIRSVKWFYTILFPLFLLILRETYVGEFTTQTFLLNLFVGVITGVIWYYYFVQGENKLNEDREEINNLINKIFS